MAEGLPLGIVPIFVRLWYQRSNGPWKYIDITFTAADQTAGSPEIVSSLPGAILVDCAVELIRDATGAGISIWWLYAGTNAEGAQIFDSGALNGVSSVTVSGYQKMEAKST